MTSRPLFDRLFVPPDVRSHAALQRVRLRVILALVIVGFFLLYDLQNLLRSADQTVVWRALNGEFIAVASLLGLYGGAVIALLAARRGLDAISGLMPILMWLSSGVLLSIPTAFTVVTDGIPLMIAVIIGFITLRERGLVIGLIMAAAVFLIGLDRRTVLPDLVPVRDTFSDFFDVSVMLVGAALALWFFLRIQLGEVAESREQAETERMRLATITTDIARSIASQTDLQDLFSRTVNEIISRYADIYHAQIFLIDELGVRARLVASTGDVGQMLLSRGHGLEVGSLSVIGTVTASGRSVIARAAGASPGETVHRRNELLPDTVTEAAFPLVLAGKTIGALDLQSRSLDAFGPDDQPIFQSLADIIAVAIENARLFEQTENRLNENQQLIDQMSTAMREIERLNRELTGRSWSDFLGDTAAAPNIDVNFRTKRVERFHEWTPGLRQAVQDDQTVQQQQSDGAVISVPIRVRGQVIGAMEFELDDPGSLDESAVLVETVSERLGLALENSRLYEATQRVAQREQQVNAIATQFQTVTTVDELLRIAVSELGTLLNADKASIRLGGVEAPIGAGREPASLNGGGSNGSGSNGAGSNDRASRNGGSEA